MNGNYEVLALLVGVILVAPWIIKVVNLFIGGEDQNEND